MLIERIRPQPCVPSIRIHYYLPQLWAFNKLAVIIIAHAAVTPGVPDASSRLVYPAAPTSAPRAGQP